MTNPSKRRLNYITGEDFYFLTYEMLIALHSWSATNKTVFKDHRKLAYLVHIIADTRLIGILERNQGRHVASPVDKELLFTSFTQGEMHKREIYKLLLALHKKGYVELVRSSQAEVFDVRLDRSKLPKGFLESEKFAEDRQNAERLKALIQRISSMNVETFLLRIYKNYGLHVWAI